MRSTSAPGHGQSPDVQSHVSDAELRSRFSLPIGCRRSPPVGRVGAFRAIHHRLSVRVIGKPWQRPPSKVHRLLDPRMQSQTSCSARAARMENTGQGPLGSIYIQVNACMSMYSGTRPVQTGDSKVMCGRGLEVIGVATTLVREHLLAYESSQMWKMWLAPRPWVIVVSCEKEPWRLDTCDRYR